MVGLSVLKHLALAAAGLAALAAPFWPGLAHSRPLAGPVAAEVTRVIDGDTIEVEARIWINQTVTATVRIAGIDTPEKGARAKCAEERAKSVEAKAYLASLVDGKEVELRDIDDDKWGGRIDASVLINGEDVGALMREKGLALAYDGGTRPSWCVARGGRPAELARK